MVERTYRSKLCLLLFTFTLLQKDWQTHRGAHCETTRDKYGTLFIEEREFSQLQTPLHTLGAYTKYHIVTAETAKINWQSNRWWSPRLPQRLGEFASRWSCGTDATARPADVTLLNLLLADLPSAARPPTQQPDLLLTVTLLFSFTDFGSFLFRVFAWVSPTNML